MRHLAALLVTTLALGAAGARQDRGRDGRWVMVGLPIAYVFRGDSVGMVMYPPQAPLMTYRVRGDSIETEVAGARRMQAYSIRGDTLHLALGANSVAYGRVGIATASAPLVRGTWHALEKTGIQVLTFRADGQLVPEVEAPVQMRIRGDTLQTFVGTQSLGAILQRSGDTITLRPQPGVKSPPGPQERKMVRRPWGCFGLAEVDHSAVECR